MGEVPLRLPILHLSEELLALPKPLGVAVLRDNWFPQAPRLAEALQVQIDADKPELLRLGLEGRQAHALFNLEPQLTGLAVFAIDASSTEAWLNAYGSEQWELTFWFLAAGEGGGESFTCDLPLARDRATDRMRVSHRTGKRTQTAFTFVERWGIYSLWQATTRYYRLHQIVLHAQEHGLRVIGDTLYHPPTTEWPRAEAYPGWALHLQRLQLSRLEGPPLTIEVPPPKGWEALQRRLERAGRVRGRSRRFS